MNPETKARLVYFGFIVLGHLIIAIYVLGR
jgi:hypothetical protein